MQMTPSAAHLLKAFFRPLKWAAVAVASVTLLIGCGPAASPPYQGPRPGQGPVPNPPASNPPFENKLQQNVITPSPDFQPSPAPVDRVTVLSADGKEMTLDLTKLPVLFQAYWCPHCQRTLVLLYQHRDTVRQPIIVSTGFVPGTTLKEAVSLTEQEEAALGVHFPSIYYLLDNNVRSRVLHQYPTLYFPSGGKPQVITGERTLEIWQRALSSN